MNKSIQARADIARRKAERAVVEGQACLERDDLEGAKKAARQDRAYTVQGLKNQFLAFVLALVGVDPSAWPK